ncbi:hypothetical protein KDL45_11715, partial [bacterium]|nr:hypothetical protein [bacterium]
MSKVTVSARSLGPSIDRRIFGHFLENMGRSIYAGGLLDKNGRPRAEIIDKIKALHVPSLRWPGGLFADGYHWTNGIGEHRPKKRNLYWGQFGSWLGPTDLNQFGTDEFLQLCEHLGAEPYVNINFANGTPQEAADWVAYCNDRPSGISGRLRAANGHDAAYNVRVWGIGNEQYGFWAFGHTTAERYARRYLEFHHAMSEADPGITPVAVGATEMWPNWNPTVLHILQEKLRYLSMHVYLPGTNVPYLLMRLPNNAKTHYALSAAGYEMSRQIHAAADQITAEYGRETHVRLAVDEWNLWWWWLQAYKVWWTMRDAVAVGGMLGALVENCQHVAMANIAQLINVLGVIRTSPAAVVATPLYHVLEMFASTLSGFRLETREEG